MLEKLANIFRVPDLRKRVLFTLGLLAVYRIGGHIPTPGINGDRLAQFFEQNRGSVLALWICSAAATCGGSRFLRWASCRTLRHRSFCSC